MLRFLFSARAKKRPPRGAAAGTGMRSAEDRVGNDAFKLGQIVRNGARGGIAVIDDLYPFASDVEIDGVIDRRSVVIAAVIEIRKLFAGDRADRGIDIGNADHVISAEDIIYSALLRAFRDGGKVILPVLNGDADAVAEAVHIGGAGKRYRPVTAVVPVYSEPVRDGAAEISVGIGAEADGSLIGKALRRRGHSAAKQQNGKDNGGHLFDMLHKSLLSSQGIRAPSVCSGSPAGLLSLQTWSFESRSTCRSSLQRNCAR